jgi:hypothetical protein
MSKKVREKITPFGERIIKVLKDNGLVKPDGRANYSKAERECGFTASFLSKAVKSHGMHEDNEKKFLRKFHVNRAWLTTGKGDTYVKNGTSDIETEQPDIWKHPVVVNLQRELETTRSLVNVLQRENDDLRGGKQK